MSNITVTLTPSSLGPNPCYTNDQARLNDYVSHTQATLPINFTTIITSATAPGPDDRDKLWAQVDGNGRLVAINTFSNGQWQTINPTSPYLITGEFRWFDPALYSPAAPWFLCDGSIAGLPDLRGSFLVAAGQRTLPPLSTDTATNFVNRAKGGRETTIAAAANVPAHTHTLSGLAGAGTANPNPTVFAVDNTVGSGANFTGGFIMGGNTTGTDSSSNPNPPSAMITLPPYYVAAIMQWRPDLA